MTEASEVPFGLEVTRGVLAKFLMAIIGFAGTIIFARILGPVAFGGFYLVWSVVQIGKLPVDGVSRAAQKRFSESETNRGNIIGAMLIVSVCLSLIAIVLATIFERNLNSFSGLHDSVLMFSLLFFCVSLFTPFQAMVVATGRVGLTIWIDFLRSILTTPLQIVFVLLSYGAAGMAYGLSLATLLVIPVTHYFLRTRPLLPDTKTFQRLWSFAKHSIVSVSLGRAYSRFDIILLGILLSPGAAGHYEVAMKLTIPAVFIPEIAGEGLMARVSNLKSKGESVGIDVSNTLMFTSILAVPIFFGAAVLSRQLVVTIYGPEFAAAAGLLVGLSLFRLLRTQSAPLIETINGLDHPDINVRITALALFVNIALGIAMTIEFGAIGVVLATVIAEGIKYVSAAYVVRGLVSDVEILPRTLLEQFGAGLVMAVGVLGAHRIFPVQSWVHLTGLVAWGATVYGIVLLAISPTLRFTALSIARDAGLYGHLQQ